MALRLLFEQLSFYNPIELMNILQNPTAAKPFLEHNVSLFLSIVTMDTDVLQSGPYKDWPKIYAAMIKLTPAQNIIRLMDPDHSTQNILRQLGPVADLLRRTNY